eukprot:2776923-Pleurochrysis_carterae.AAC.1
MFLKRPRSAGVGVSTFSRAPSSEPQSILPSEAPVVVSHSVPSQAAEHFFVDAAYKHAHHSVAYLEFAVHRRRR